MPLGIATEERPYNAHLTLARIKEPAPLQALRNAIAQLESVDYGSFPVDRFYLYRSQPGQAGSIYTKLSEYPLRPDESCTMMPLLAVVIAFLVGGIPFGYLLVRWKTGEDVRAKGSGNIGATNVLRTTGRAVAVATLLLDIAKGCSRCGWRTSCRTGRRCG